MGEYLIHSQLFSGCKSDRFENGTTSDGFCIHSDSVVSDLTEEIKTIYNIETSGSKIKRIQKF